MIELSIIIPCYNESDSLVNLFKACRDGLEGREEIEFVFVNNGSKDDSQVVMNELSGKPENFFAKIVEVKVNQGYGYGILQGLKEARGNILAWTHADLQTDPKDVIKAYCKFKESLINEKVVVKGKRKGRNPFDVFFTGGMSIISSILLGTWLSDINAQPKIFHRNFFSKMDRSPNDFSLDLYLLYNAAREGYSILEFPVYFGKRTHGEAKGGGTLKGKIKLIKRTFSYILELRKEINRGER